MFRRLAIHPVLFSIYPILALYAYNIEQLPFKQIFIPSGIILTVTALLFLILNLLLKNKQKTALILSAVILLFFSYGHVNDFVRYLSLAAGLTGSWFLLKTDKGITKITQIANLFSTGLIAITIVNIIISGFSGTPTVETNKYRPEMIKPSIENKFTNNLPDIYYIVLDGYARADILREIYKYDNSEFLNFLRQKQFQIAYQSRSNYCQTLLSLSSTLNMIYLDELAEEMGAETENRKPLLDMLRNCYVFDFLKQYDYKIIATASGYSGTEIRNADYYLSPGVALNEFENMLISSTPIPKFIKYIPFLDQHQVHRNMISFAFDKLADLSETEAPRFVMAHIVAPHPPFVFGPNGEELSILRPFDFSDGSHYLFLEGASRIEYIKKYWGQIRYINSQVRVLIDKLLARPGKKPIIILQADHGPGALLDWEYPEETYFKERLSIFNAYYLPDGDSTIIYDSITPVNSFRVIFNHYFGAGFELLDDKSYFTKWSAPYKFYDVTELMKYDKNPDIMFR